MALSQLGYAWHLNHWVTGYVNHYGNPVIVHRFSKEANARKAAMARDFRKAR
jgi:hypothetical protein